MVRDNVYTYSAVYSEKREARFDEKEKIAVQCTLCSAQCEVSSIYIIECAVCSVHRYSDFNAKLLWYCLL